MQRGITARMENSSRLPLVVFLVVLFALQPFNPVVLTKITKIVHENSKIVCDNAFMILATAIN